MVRMAVKATVLVSTTLRPFISTRSQFSRLISVEDGTEVLLPRRQAGAVWFCRSRLRGLTWAEVCAEVSWWEKTGSG